MEITIEELNRYNIKFDRVAATDSSEEYIIFADEKESVREGNVNRLGRVIIQYATVENCETYVKAALLLDTDFGDAAITHLIKVIDQRIVDTLGAGNALSRHDFNTEIYLVTEYMGNRVDHVESN